MLSFTLSFMLLFSEPDTVTDTEQQVWQQYYRLSATIKQADQQFLQVELAARSASNYTLPNATRHFGFETTQPAAWYRSTAGQMVVAAMLSLQTPSGGWSKRTDMTVPRQPGQHFGVETKYVPTFDNSATSTQLRVLAQAITATGDSRYLEPFYRGLQLILYAQYPHGGWPQNYPLVGGYHDHVTINDEVTEELLSLLLACSLAQAEFSFVEPYWQQQAADAVQRAVAFLLKIQQRDAQGLSLWAAQYDHRTLTPAWARAYEMPALAVMESASLLEVLMAIPEPAPALQQSIHGAAAWLQRHAVHNKRWHRTERILIDQPDAAPTWPRFVEIGSNRAIFGDRDQQIYYDVHQVSFERRLGYAWYSERPAQSLVRYQQWAAQWPAP